MPGRATTATSQSRENILAALCALAVILSVMASIATTRSNLSISASGYTQATEQKALLLDQVRQKQEAIDVCTAANRITLCARPLQAELSELTHQLNNLVIPAPDEATALVMEVGNLSGLAFDEAATLVVALVSIMLDASGLYFLYKQTVMQEPIIEPLSDTKAEALPESEKPAGGLHTHVYGDVNLSVSLGVDDLLRKSLELIQSRQVKPSVRSLAESLELPQHTAQTILTWLADAGHIKRQDSGRGYTLSPSQM